MLNCIVNRWFLFLTKSPSRCAISITRLLVKAIGLGVRFGGGIEHFYESQFLAYHIVLWGWNDVSGAFLRITIRAKRIRFCAMFLIQVSARRTSSGLQSNLQRINFLQWCPISSIPPLWPTFSLSLYPLLRMSFAQSQALLLTPLLPPHQSGTPSQPLHPVRVVHQINYSFRI